MSANILLGPILGFEEGDFYTVCFLSDPLPEKVKLQLKMGVLAAPVDFKEAGRVGGKVFWRAEFTLSVPAKGSQASYAIELNGKPLANAQSASWSFYVPGEGEEPRILYTSCNGFSSAKLARDTEKPYALWERMAKLQSPKKNPGPEAGPYALMLMGGDQVYADEIWESGRCPLLREWSHLGAQAQQKAQVSPALAKEIEDFYNGLYLDRWKAKDMANMLAAIPSVMMWDDHDIFDGWGSYPSQRHNCPVFQKVFLEASRVFQVFQLRCSTRSRLNANPDREHFSLRLQFREYHILALDNRAERTIEQIMSRDHWDDVKQYLDALPAQDLKNLLVLSGVPVVYRSFATVESVFESTPWNEELQDDVQDHWSARTHQAERIKFVMIFLNFLHAKTSELENPPVGADPSPLRSAPRVVLLSGDVHVGAVGQVWDAPRQVGLTQIISSGIVHPPPTALAFASLKLMTSDTPEPLGEGDVIAEMMTPVGSDRYLRTRNFVAMHLGSDEKLWVNWICEDKDIRPSFAIG